MEVWVIVSSLTVLNLAPTYLLSNMAFNSQEICTMALAGEPRSEGAVCKPMQLVIAEKAPKGGKPSEPKGEGF